MTYALEKRLSECLPQGTRVWYGGRTGRILYCENLIGFETKQVNNLKKTVEVVPKEDREYLVSFPEESTDGRNLKPLLLRLSEKSLDYRKTPVLPIEIIEEF